ncbi:sucrase ferredoxin [Micromonospora sp. DT43]|uniref:sucrase ferredoxin n=1 Tax=Micromonospora sp. DT43 TaxID=3393440 RepID=UPI003CF09BB9
MTTTAEAPAHRCSYLAGLLGDPLTATALETRGWILVEHEGPWGKNALRESDLDPALVAEIEARTDATGVRVQLISPPPGSPPGACYIAGDPRDTRAPWLVRLGMKEVGDVLGLDFAAIAAGHRPDGGEPAGPLYAVCANEQSDPCCGSTGRQVHAAAADRLGDRVRRTAHVGGHKYAANMVVFPYALYYGRLDPHSVLNVLDANEAGHLFADKYRGRSTFSIAEQAAEQHLRRVLGLTALDAVTLLEAARSPGDRRHHVRLAAAGREYTVTVTERDQLPARLQSCTDKGPTVPVEWLLEDVAG